jgi:hypothetical protein
MDFLSRTRGRNLRVSCLRSSLSIWSADPVSLLLAHTCTRQRRKPFISTHMACDPRVGVFRLFYEIMGKWLRFGNLAGWPSGLLSRANGQFGSFVDERG